MEAHNIWDLSSGGLQYSEFFAHSITVFQFEGLGLPEPPKYVGYFGRFWGLDDHFTHFVGPWYSLNMVYAYKAYRVHGGPRNCHTGFFYRVPKPETLYPKPLSRVLL